MFCFVSMGNWLFQLYICTSCTCSHIHVHVDHLDQLEWEKKYVVLDKDDRKLYFFNDTEVSKNIR